MELTLDNYDCLRQVMILRSYERLRRVMNCLAAMLTSSGNHIITKAEGFLITFAVGKFIT